MELISKKTAQDVIFEGLSLGADFVDIFVEKTKNKNISFKNSKAEEIQSGIIFGVGIRLIFGHQTLYGYTNLDEREELLRITRLLAHRYQQKKAAEAVSFETLVYPKVKSIDDRDVDLNYQVDFLSKIDKKLRLDPKISQVSLGVLQKNQSIEIFNSEGLHAFEIRPYIRFLNQVVMKDGNSQADAFQGPGARGGWEFIEALNHEAISNRVLSMASTNLYAEPCPAGKMPVIIDKGFGGVIFHEACGHLLETTSVEKKASVFWDKKNEKIAHEALSATDDGTIDCEWGSLAIDDEGTPTQKTLLIENGILKNFISDRMGELKTGHIRTGSGRKQSYKFAPASRMRNTFINPGKFSLEELLSTVDYGLYAASMGGGSVNPGTGEFNFAVQEAYLVEKGKITKPVKGATLIGSGANVMTKISMVGKDLELAAGMCGSVSGSIPTTVGQPPIKVDEILVGGRS